MTGAGPPPSGDGGQLAGLLVEHRDALLRFVGARAGALLGHETADDLVQGIHLRALEVADRFEFRGEREFRGWMVALARQHLADRREYWSALRRKAGRLLRLTALGADTRVPAGGRVPASPAAGPSTLASRNEGVERAMRAVEVLFPRDRDLLRWIADSVSVQETASRLGVSLEAAKKARLRAVGRFRKAFEVLSRAGGHCST